ncbi:hypothetical protein OS493_037602 [Desmophyllum pertusum]|uniref:Uncharacterized protein n=1 Tax=Desmophyllum pertusum TaxID=174260 RepID=A0A9X0D6B3_9CNID|nr:hypothetical protein OS493_037602 [Desmophyllum pertusum]
MKVIAATFLFISAAAALRNLIGLPETTSNKLHQLLKDGPFDATELMNYRSNSKATARLASAFKKNVNDHVEKESGLELGSGSEPGPVPGSGPESEPIREAIKTVADSLSDIAPALKILKEASHKRNQEAAREFIHALESDEDDSDVREVVGRHVIENHERCKRAKEFFVKSIHESELFELSKSEDALDLEEDVGKVLESAKMNDEADVFEEFSNLVNKHRLHDHPGIKVAVTLGGMLADAYCDVELDGLLKKIGDFLQHHELDLSNKIKPYLSGLKNGHCQAPVTILGFFVDYILESIKFARMQDMILKDHETALIKKVTEFAKENKMNLAYEAVGQSVFDNLRGATIVGEVIRHFKQPGPKPSAQHGSQRSPKSKSKSRPKASRKPKSKSRRKPSSKSSSRWNG